MKVKKVQVQILIKNSKYGHDYEVVRADSFFDNKDLQENFRKKKEQEWHEFLQEECNQEINEDHYVDWYGDIEPIQLEVREVTDEEI
jgi:hypothetical protein